MLLANFKIIRPRFEFTQEETLNWLVDAHLKAGADLSIKEKLWHVGCKPDRIHKRGSVFNDFSHKDWDKMEVYRLNESPTGLDLSVRARIFEKEVALTFKEFYPEGANAPKGIVHVSCTGYVSPSGAQLIVSERGWGQTTTVTQVGHMGCYASIPAIRIATEGTDIVHTELCSLHSNPSKHASDQLVCQSLFADGFIKYSMMKESNEPSLRILRLKEEIIPNSAKAMTWNVMGWGFEMSLAKEIPVLIVRNLKGYLERLQIPENALFAIHPGGPKILTQIQELLALSDQQMAYSFQILKEYGNMSSATLPHIWERILNDKTIPSGTPIVSLAFGPGLTIAGAVMEKVCGY